MANISHAAPIIITEPKGRRPRGAGWAFGVGELMSLCFPSFSPDRGTPARATYHPEAREINWFGVCGAWRRPKGGARMPGVLLADLGEPECGAGPRGTALPDASSGGETLDSVSPGAGNGARTHDPELGKRGSRSEPAGNKRFLGCGGARCDASGPIRPPPC